MNTGLNNVGDRYGDLLLVEKVSGGWIGKCTKCNTSRKRSSGSISTYRRGVNGFNCRECRDKDNVKLAKKCSELYTKLHSYSAVGKVVGIVQPRVKSLLTKYHPEVLDMPDDCGMTFYEIANCLGINEFHARTAYQDGIMKMKSICEMKGIDFNDLCIQ